MRLFGLGAGHRGASSTLTLGASSSSLYYYYYYYYSSFGARALASASASASTSTAGSAVMAGTPSVLVRSQIHRFSTSSSLWKKHASAPAPAPTPTLTPVSLPHLTATSTVRVVPISTKRITPRSAIAIGHVAFSTPHPLVLIRAHALRKGDVLAVARVAAITAAKKTSDWIPLCHSGVPIEGIRVRVGVVDGQLDGEEEAMTTFSPTFPSPSLVAQQTQSESESPSGSHPPSTSPSPVQEQREVDFANEPSDEGEPLVREFENSLFATPLPPFGGVRISVRVDTTAKTGVEMEALVGVVGAGLAVVDMCKGVDRGLVLEGAKVVGKRGGASGPWGLWESKGTIKGGEPVRGREGEGREEEEEAVREEREE